MTVSYSRDLVTIKWWSFLRILFRWRGSIYKLVLPDLLVFLSLFALFSLTYRFAMSAEVKDVFERFCVYCSQFENLIPVVFILGFFVQLIVSRWTEQSQAIPYPDNLAFLLNVFLTSEEESQPHPEAAAVPGSSRAAKTHVDGTLETESVDRAKLIRRTIMRYANLSIAAAFRRISYPVKKQIPTEEDFVKLQLMTEEEMKAWNEFPVENKYFLPLSWSSSLLAKARSEGLIKNDYHLKVLSDAIGALRGSIGKLFFYDFISPPLAYTQATTICVYSFFLSTLFGRQFLVPPEKFKHVLVDAYVPVFTIFQFMFYVGWLKVAEELINPYGKDDEDLDIVHFITRNIEVSGSMVGIVPPTSLSTDEDLKWDSTDSPLPPGPWTPGIRKREKKIPFTGSTHDLRVKSSHEPLNRQISAQSSVSGKSLVAKSLVRDVERGPEDIELTELQENPRVSWRSAREKDAPMAPLITEEEPAADIAEPSGHNEVA